MAPWLPLIVVHSEFPGRDYHILMRYDCFFIPLMFVCFYYYLFNLSHIYIISIYGVWKPREDNKVRAKTHGSILPKFVL